MPIYELSHARYKIMYMYQPTVPWRKEIYFLHFFTLRKECVLKGKARGRGKSNKTKLIVKTYSGFNRLDADQWDQLVERLRWCGDSILLSCCREGLCYRFFELSSASCYVQA